MKVSLDLKKVFLALVLTVILALGFHSRYTPYGFKNTFHAHRWSSDVCKSAGVGIEHCSMPVQTRGEIAYFDICLEHGEFRRVK